MTEEQKEQITAEALRENNTEMLLDAIEYREFYLPELEKEILKKLIYPRAESLDFEEIMTISEVIYELEFYDALIELDLLFDYLNKDKLEDMLAWVKEEKKDLYQELNDEGFEELGENTKYAYLYETIVCTSEQVLKDFVINRLKINK